ncbi:MAG TPA: SpoIID/LytB domain-containing protein [Candidatus Eremiobacteraceae bacterium]|nr:SpoIID/LytB domain-containing protein [Candidatus Eremiobacteraceae bacterium]
MLVLCGAAAAPARAADYVRIAVARHVRSTVIASESALLVRPLDQSDARAPFVAPDLSTVLELRASAGHLVIAGEIPAGHKIAIVSPLGLPIAVDGKPYRGSMIVQVDPDGELTVVNVIDLEQYLYGVVGSEMPEGWPSAALQAQAVVARTYAIGRLGLHDDVGYDLVAGEADQAYRGIDGESAPVIAAVDATRAVIIVYDGQIVHAYYSADDGGYTADGADLSDPQPYLVPVPDPYATGSPDRSWTASIDAAGFAQAVSAVTGPVGSLTGVEAGSSDLSGRLRSVWLSGSAGATTLSGFDFRRLAGRHLVRSTRITKVALDGPIIKVAGTGFGHGVGMSQWGARTMAAARFGYTDILRFYYRGTVLTTIADAPQNMPTISGGP